MDAILSINGLPPTKPLQVLRILTRSRKLAQRLPKKLLEELNNSLSELFNSPGMLLENLALHARFIELSPSLLTDVMFGKVLDVLAAATHP